MRYFVLIVAAYQVMLWLPLNIGQVRQLLRSLGKLVKICGSNSLG
jgi:hypothetical protein